MNTNDLSLSLIETEAEHCSCDWCGRTVDLDATVDGYCPECDGLNGDRDEAANELVEAEAEVERIKEELAEALRALKAARKADQKAAAKLDAAWMARTAE